MAEECPQCGSCERGIYLIDFSDMEHSCTALRHHRWHDEAPAELGESCLCVEPCGKPADHAIHDPTEGEHPFTPAEPSPDDHDEKDTHKALDVMAQEGMVSAEPSPQSSLAFSTPATLREIAIVHEIGIKLAAIGVCFTFDHHTGKCTAERDDRRDETQSSAQPEIVNFGGNIGPRLKLLKPIPVEVTRENSEVMVWSNDLEDYGYGESVGVALEDFGRTIEDSWDILHSHKLGSHLQEILRRQEQFIAERSSLLAEAGATAAERGKFLSDGSDQGICDYPGHNHFAEVPHRKMPHCRNWIGWIVPQTGVPAALTAPSPEPQRTIKPCGQCQTPLCEHAWRVSDQYTQKCDEHIKQGAELAAARQRIADLEARLAPCRRYKASQLTHGKACEECDSTCFISSGPDHYVCYHCWLAEQVDDLERRVAELKRERLNDRTAYWKERCEIFERQCAGLRILLDKAINKINELKWYNESGREATNIFLDELVRDSQPAPAKEK